LSSDEFISVEVSDEEVDAAISKLEEAMDLKEQVESVDTAPVEAAAEEVDSVLASRGEVEAVKAEAQEAAEMIEQIRAEEPRLKGNFYAIRRVVNLIPGLAQAWYLLRQISRLMALNPEIAAIIIAAQVLSMILSYFREIDKRYERAMREQEELVREYRRFTRAEYEHWYWEQYQRRQDYRSVSPP